MSKKKTCFTMASVCLSEATTNANARTPLQPPPPPPPPVEQTSGKSENE